MDPGQGQARAFCRPKPWDRSSQCLTTVRSIKTTIVPSTLALKTLLNLPRSPTRRPTDPKEALRALTADFSICPPERSCFQPTRYTIERRLGRWLKELARRSQAAVFEQSF